MIEFENKQIILIDPGSYHVQKFSNFNYVINTLIFCDKNKNRIYDTYFNYHKCAIFFH